MNFGSILIFATCVVGTLSFLNGTGLIILFLKYTRILYGLDLYVLLFLHYNMVGVGIFTLGGEF